MKKQKKQPQLESQNLILYPLLPEQMNLLRDDPNELCRSLSLVRMIMPNTANGSCWQRSNTVK